MKRYPTSLALAGALSLTASVPALAKDGPQSDKNRPNILFIFADDLGYGDISCNGSPTVSTPNVDRLAREGVRFTNAHAVASTSTPSRYSVLTGEYAWRRPGTGVARGDAAMIITPDRQTLPDMLQRAGYATGAIGKWHLGLGSETGKQNWNERISPALDDIGFDYSFIMAATGDRVPCVYIENGQVAGLDPDDPIEVSYTAPFPGEPTGKDNPELLTMRSSHGHNQALINGIGRIGYMKGGKSALWKDEEIADRITEKAVAFIEEHKDEPFFLYFATNDIHVPRVPHARFAGRSGMGPRGDAILSFDWSVGQLLDKLDELGLTKNTLVILTSDNGPVVDDGYRDEAVEKLGDHKPWGHMRGGKYSSFEAGTCVPTLVRWPGHTPRNRTSAAALSQIDLFASLAALTGTELNEGEAPDSRNELSAWLGKDKRGREYVIEKAYAASVLQGPWKYIEPNGGAKKNHYTNTELGNDKQPQLYRLDTDPGERNNVAAEYPNKTAELSFLLETVKNRNDNVPFRNGRNR